ncbi:MAG: glycosyltransferase family 4 protein [Eubacteriales bacterium]
MKIQVVSQFYYPDNFKINEITEELTRLGHEVKVLTGLPDYTTGNIPKEYRLFRNRKQNVLGAEIKRVPIIARRKGAAFRAFNYASFIVTSSLHAIFSKKPDCDAIFVYETSPVFQALPAIIWKKRTGIKLVLYCCDLWPESMKAWGVKENSLIYRMVKSFSGWLYRSCDVVAITSKPFKEYLVDICRVDSDKIVYLPQHADDIYSDIVGEYEYNGTIDFLFAGNIGAVQNIDCIIEATELIEKDKDFVVHILGDGSELAKCKNMVSSKKLDDKIVFHGRVPQMDTKKYYKLADCFLLTLSADSFIGMTLPAKAQGYLSAGKPIAAAINGAAREMIEAADCGEAAAAGDAKGLAEKMSIIVDDFESYKQKGINGRKYYEKNYTKEIFIESMLNILKD